MMTSGSISPVIDSRSVSEYLRDEEEFDSFDDVDFSGDQQAARSADGPDAGECRTWTTSNPICPDLGSASGADGPGDGESEESGRRLLGPRACECVATLVAMTVIVASAADAAGRGLGGGAGGTGGPRAGPEGDAEGGDETGGWVALAIVKGAAGPSDGPEILDEGEGVN